MPIVVKTVLGGVVTKLPATAVPIGAARPRRYRETAGSGRSDGGRRGHRAAQQESSCRRTAAPQL